MREAFLQELIQAAEDDPSVVLLVGDLGFGVIEPFAERFPEQFINAGVAEQNLIGVAAGLAASGLRPFVYSIANFPTLRCLEQIRNDVCYHNLSVSVVSVGAGLSYGSLGYSHFAIEDISIMRSLPGIRIISPADPVEARATVSEALRASGPVYIRLGKGRERPLHLEAVTSLSHPLVLAPGRDLTMVSTGSIVAECLEARLLLRAVGVDSEVVSCPTIKPLDLAWLSERPEDSPIVVIEEHRRAGGLGSAVLEAVNDLGLRTRCVRLGLSDVKLDVVGTGDFLRDRYELTPEHIVAVCRELATMPPSEM